MGVSSFLSIYIKEYIYIYCIARPRERYSENSYRKIPMGRLTTVHYALTVEKSEQGIRDDLLRLLV